ncbi:MAG TPA: YebC/PmpR family DNA-binding transcriptional regulator [Planctomycetota bacterium]|nr:YebC/PmpR family DNA-binding transcriptional regulator [Planctomycetota bacterium]
MSGHSHWATIKHKKGAADAKKGKLFSKIARLIILAARQGGGDPKMNLKLAYALEEARAANMPKDNVERAIKRGTGELEGITFEEVNYEGYGPGGVAFLVEALTDNKNRSAAEIRKIFEGVGGNLGTAGSVRRLFERKGVIYLPAAGVNEDQLMSDVLDAGADNMERSGELFEITTGAADFDKVRKALAEKKYKIERSELAMWPSLSVSVDEEVGAKILRLMEALDESDDVQKIYANFQLPESLLKA